MGRRFRILNVLKDAVHDGLAIKVDVSLAAERLIRVTKQLITWRGMPEATSGQQARTIVEPFVAWCNQHSIELRYIKPG